MLRHLPPLPAVIRAELRKDAGALRVTLTHKQSGDVLVVHDARLVEFSTLDPETGGWLLSLWLVPARTARDVLKELPTNARVLSPREASYRLEADDKLVPVFPSDVTLDDATYNGRHLLEGARFVTPRAEA